MSVKHTKGDPVLKSTPGKFFFSLPFDSLQTVLQGGVHCLGCALIEPMLLSMFSEFKFYRSPISFCQMLMTLSLLTSIPSRKI